MSNFVPGSSRTINKLNRKSTDIISVFTKTQADLAAVNQDVASEIDDRQEQIDLLLAEQNELKAIHAGNLKIKNKINKFLYDDMGDEAKDTNTPSA